ncbi:hypothetical protein [Ornithinimicrobium kibberense]|uniref:hypothetical protein n=1 Tax=Ornithinimicrobium kibberense TaxID=282060 RepID=UPI003621B5DC
MPSSRGPPRRGGSSGPGTPRSPRLPSPAPVTTPRPCPCCSTCRSCRGRTDPSRRATSPTGPARCPTGGPPRRTGPAGRCGPPGSSSRSGRPGRVSRTPPCWWATWSPGRRPGCCTGSTRPPACPVRRPTTGNARRTS